MGVPGWLLNLVMGYLAEREMLIQYKGERSDKRTLPGGGPQGGLLGALLFIVLVNDCGLKTSPENNLLNLKYVDDMSVLEPIDLRKQLTLNENRETPDNFRARTGHKLPPDQSEVYKEIKRISNYTQENQMKLNLQKTKLMVFNSSTTRDFDPQFKIENFMIQVVEET